MTFDTAPIINDQPVEDYLSPQQRLLKEIQSRGSRKSSPNSESLSRESSSNPLTQNQYTQTPSKISTTEAKIEIDTLTAKTIENQLTALQKLFQDENVSLTQWKAYENNITDLGYWSKYGTKENGGIGRGKQIVQTFVADIKNITASKGILSCLFFCCCESENQIQKREAGKALIRSLQNLSIYKAEGKLQSSKCVGYDSCIN